MDNYRTNAKAHLARAKDKVNSQKYCDRVYACLDLRMCMEAICYSLLCTYYKNYNNAAEDIRVWQPKKVIDELLMIDPYADQTSSIRIAKEKSLGVPDGEFKNLGTDCRLNIKWLNKQHNKLGSYLHEKTPKQKKTNKLPELDKIFQELDKVLSSRVYNNTFGIKHDFRCVNCEFPIIRSGKYLSEQLFTSCSKCNSIYDYKKDGDQYDTILRRITYVCRSCNLEQYFDAHLIQENAVVLCDNKDCGNKVKIVYSLEDRT